MSPGIPFKFGFNPSFDGLLATRHLPSSSPRNSPTPLTLPNVPKTQNLQKAVPDSFPFLDLPSRLDPLTPSGLYSTAFFFAEFSFLFLSTFLQSVGYVLFSFPLCCILLKPFFLFFFFLCLESPHLVVLSGGYFVLPTERVIDSL